MGKLKKCIECNKRYVMIKKRGLCHMCYALLREKHGPLKKENKTTQAELYKDGEKSFVKNYFSDPSKWIKYPAMFRFNNLKYSPDFYDVERNVFIEVSRTRQAYCANKNKYKMFKKYFPKLKFEIRRPDGSLLDVENPAW